MADLPPAEELRAAAARLREVAARASRAPWNTNGPWVIGANSHVAHFGHLGNRDWAALVHPGLAEPLATWLEKEALAARDHLPLPDYAGLPDHRWCVDCQDEECSGLQALDAALVIARVILGGGEKPDGAW